MHFIGRYTVDSVVVGGVGRPAEVVGGQGWNGRVTLRAMTFGALSIEAVRKWFTINGKISGREEEKSETPRIECFLNTQ